MAAESETSPSTSDYVPYQRGNLREAFIGGALVMLRERGEAGFSLTELAGHLGVSPGASYRHFASKDALLLAVCALGFTQLRAALAEPIRDETAAGQRILTLGVRYVQFAVDSPDVFSMMFGRRTPDDLLTGTDAFDPLVSAVAQAQAEGLLPSQDPRRVAGSIWVMLHGIALLHLNGGLHALGLDGEVGALVKDNLSLVFPELVREPRNN